MNNDDLKKILSEIENAIAIKKEFSTNLGPLVKKDAGPAEDIICRLPVKVDYYPC